MLFQQLRHDQNVVNFSYLYKKYVCIYTYCVTRTELLVGQAGKSSACVMDFIWEELKWNNIDIDNDMLSFYISKCLDEQREMYGSLNSQLSPMCFQPVFEEMNVNNLVGRIIAYLAFVYRLNDLIGLIGWLSYFTMSCMLNVAKVEICITSCVKESLGGR